MDPKADGGSNHLDNRALLCKCNGTKGIRLNGRTSAPETKDGHLGCRRGLNAGDEAIPRLPEARARTGRHWNGTGEAADSLRMML